MSSAITVCSMPELLPPGGGRTRCSCDNEIVKSKGNRSIRSAAYFSAPPRLIPELEKTVIVMPRRELLTPADRAALPRQ